MSMSHAQIRQRYPHIIRAMVWTAILSEGEAVSAIAGYQETPRREYTSEAVGVYGGASQAIQNACRFNNRVITAKITKLIAMIPTRPEA
jgi:hypothetical protein